MGVLAVVVVGAGVHEAGVLAGGTVEWVVVCRRLGCWLEGCIARGASIRVRVRVRVS